MKIERVHNIGFMTESWKKKEEEVAPQKQPEVIKAKTINRGCGIGFMTEQWNVNEEYGSNVGQVDVATASPQAAPQAVAPQAEPEGQPEAQQALPDGSNIPELAKATLQGYDVSQWKVNPMTGNPISPQEINWIQSRDKITLKQVAAK